ncbi:MAG: FAD:protein FMN transferase, partial [Bacteroidales bacterium]|nr:FAD:protein FMN transferase [Bacteroidales bacterium]
MRRIFYLILSVALLSACSKKGAEYLSADGFAQGSTYHIVYSIPETATDKEKFQAMVEELIGDSFNQINKSVSGYDSTSILSRSNRGDEPQLNRIFLDLFNYAQQIYKESNGAVDASAAPLFDIWGFGFKNKIPVTQEKIDSIKQFVGMDKVQLSSNGYLIKSDPRISLNFNAIAQGYTADFFASRFDSLGIENYLLEIGGEIYCKGLSSKGRKWRVGIDAPRDG